MLGMLAVLLLSASFACGRLFSQPEPEIEATVEARIEGKQAEDAAQEAKAQDTEKTMVEATAQAVPTVTPVPPSTRCTSSPNPVPPGTARTSAPTPPDTPVMATLWAWGNNGNGQLGDGTNNNKATPTQIGSATWPAISARGYHTVALKSDGTRWAWGANHYGQLGDGTNNRKDTPTQESTGVVNWSALSAGGYHTVALKSDGTLWGWGWNNDGQLGDRTDAKKNTPTQESTGAANWSAIAAGAQHTIALKSDGTLWAWGRNNDGQLGDGTDAKKNTPTQESTGAANWSAIAAGLYHTVALKSDGTLWAWGRNTLGQLGDGTTANKATPTQIGSAAWSAISAGWNHTVALKSDDTLWAWGYDEGGLLYLRDGPGTLWAWGNNTNGQLGDGTNIRKDTPTLESTGSARWSAISAGSGHTVGLKSDGTLWAWGNNTYGQLGDRSHNDKNTPTQIGLATWSAIAAGFYHTVGLRIKPLQYAAPPPMTIDPTKNYTATFVMDKGGEFEVELFADDAPETVNNFVFLAREGYYDAVTFYRVIADFMAQSGDPTGTGSGDPGYRFENELTRNRCHDGPGVLSMANSGGTNTNGSQFFITFREAGFLDGYNPDGTPKSCEDRTVSCNTVFGKVINGLDVVMNITIRDPNAATTPGDMIETITIKTMTIKEDQAR